MDILFVVPYVPNLVRTRPYNLIRHLTARGHRVTVLTLWTNEQERVEVERLQQQCYQVEARHMPAWRSLWNYLPALASGVPLQSVFSWQPTLVTGLNGRTAFDVVHVEHLRGARYGLYLRSARRLPVVWDSVDCITHLFQQAAEHSKNLAGRWRSRFELARTERYEGWLLNQFDHILVTSAIDRQRLVSLRADGIEPSPAVSVLWNGVDLSYFSPDTAVAREPATLVVTGKMSYHANITMVLHLAQDIMPRVWAHRPDVKLWIVGKDPAREVRALDRNPAITVTGTVDDLRPYLRRATIAVSPVTYGAGVQNKVLEAMACGTPVVTTPQAVSALAVVPGRDVLVAPDANGLAQAILTLLASPTRQQAIGMAGRTYVETHHDWQNIAFQLEEIYQAIIHRARSDVQQISNGHGSLPPLSRYHGPVVD